MDYGLAYGLAYRHDFNSSRNFMLAMQNLKERNQDRALQRKKFEWEKQNESMKWLSDNVKIGQVFDKPNSDKYNEALPGMLTDIYKFASANPNFMSDSESMGQLQVKFNELLNHSSVLDSQHKKQMYDQMNQYYQDNPDLKLQQEADFEKWNDYQGGTTDSWAWDAPSSFNAMEEISKHYQDYKGISEIGQKGNAIVSRTISPANSLDYAKSLYGRDEETTEQFDRWFNNQTSSDPGLKKQYASPIEYIRAHGEQLSGIGSESFKGSIGSSSKKSNPEADLLQSHFYNEVATKSKGYNPAISYFLPISSPGGTGKTKYLNTTRLSFAENGKMIDFVDVAEDASLNGNLRVVSNGYGNWQKFGDLWYGQVEVVVDPQALPAAINDMPFWVRDGYLGQYLDKRSSGSKPVKDPDTDEIIVGPDQEYYYGKTWVPLTFNNKTIKKYNDERTGFLPGMEPGSNQPQQEGNVILADPNETISYEEAFK